MSCDGRSLVKPRPQLTSLYSLMKSKADDPKAAMLPIAKEDHYAVE